MGRWDADDDFDDDDDDWSEDAADDGAMDCPHCGEEMYDDCVRCPHCGRYLSTEDGGEPKKPAWIMITAVALLIVMLSLLTMFF